MAPNKESTDVRLRAVSGSGRCTFLLASLIGLILLYPIGADSWLGEIVFIITSAIVYVAGVYVIAPERHTLAVIAGIALVASALEMTSIFLGEEMLFNLSIVFSTALYLLIIRHVLLYIFAHGPITADKIHGATAVFITLGFMWTGFYVLIENLQPGSFSFASERSLGDPWRFYDLLYFSFTTVTTVGYGDIAPVSHYARMLSILEQIVGVFFVAVLIARLAGVYIPHSRVDEAEATKLTKDREGSSK